MAVSRETTVAPLPEVTARRWSGAGEVLRLARQKPLGAFGGLIVLLLVFLALTADVLAPYDPIAVSVAGPGKSALLPPSDKTWFGTDDLGRDVFSRVFFGARVSLIVGLASVALGVSAGSIWGLLSGYFGGRFDLVTQRLLDILMALPGLIMALAMVAVLGPSMRT